MKARSNNCWQRCREGNTCALLVGMKIGIVIKKNSMDVSQKLKISTAITAILLLYIYLKKMKILTQKDT